MPDIAAEVMPLAVLDTRQLRLPRRREAHGDGKTQEKTGQPKCAHVLFLSRRRVDSNFFQRLEIRWQCGRAFLVAALAQKERQNSDVVLRLQAAGIAFGHGVRNQIEEITQGAATPLPFETLAGMFSHHVARGTGDLKFLASAFGLIRREEAVGQRRRCGRALGGNTHRRCGRRDRDKCGRNRQAPLDGHEPFYRTFTYLRSRWGRGSPAKMFPWRSMAIDSAPLPPAVIGGLSPVSRMNDVTHPVFTSPMRIPFSQPGFSVISDSESAT